MFHIPQVGSKNGSNSELMESLVESLFLVECTGGVEDGVVARKAAVNTKAAPASIRNPVS
jgi:hypothetical protein